MIHIKLDKIRNTIKEHKIIHFLYDAGPTHQVKKYKTIPQVKVNNKNFINEKVIFLEKLKSSISLIINDTSL